MANSRICSIPDCGKPISSRGWCRAHYVRWLRHGDPLKGNATPGTSERRVQEALLWGDSVACLPWTGHVGTRGYGRCFVNGREHLAHRLICELTHGAAPTESHQAAHFCGNAACVNPHHIRWATPSENNADKHIHGTAQVLERNPKAKLTRDQVQEIRKRAAETGVNKTALAREYGISRENLGHILAGRSWAALSLSEPQ